MEVDLSNAFDLVSQGDSKIIKQGQHLLALLKKGKTYPFLLLHYMNNPNITEEGKLRAAIELRIWCRQFKDLEQFQQHFYNQCIQGIKENILVAYLTQSLKISKTLRPGIICLSQVFFPTNWPNLITGLLQYFNNFPKSCNAVLKLIENITHKYTYMTRSDQLYEQIIKVCNQVHDFVLDLTSSILSNVLTNPSNVSNVTVLELLMKIFFNLNYQDLHPKFQDHLAQWMHILKQIMGLNNRTTNNNTNQNIFKCKGAALQSILLYASKYKQDVEEPIKGFCQQIWTLCLNASQDTQYDQVVFNCLKFFKSLIMWNDMKTFFNQNMDMLITNLIIPNIGRTRFANDLFCDEIDVYIDYYFRNSELQTRRAAALQLLRVICRQYTSFQPFLQRQLLNYHNLTQKNFSAECTIINLVIDGGSKGFRDIDGTTTLYIRQQLIHYCYQEIVKKALAEIYQFILGNQGVWVEKQYDVMHVVTIIRFLFFFRIYLPKEQLSSILEILTSIKTENSSLKKVIYLSINGFLIMKHGDFINYKNFIPFFTSSNMPSISLKIFHVIYQATASTQFLIQSITKMFYNTSKSLALQNNQFYSYQIEIIKQMLKKTSTFDFSSVLYVFQTIGLLAYWYIRKGGTNADQLEAQMFKYFQLALNNKSDLLNFCLQIFSIYLQLQNSVNSQYHMIYNSLLDSENWKEENQSIMSSYIQFITAYLTRSKENLVKDRGSFETILSKIIEIDHYDLFFRFLESIMLAIGLDEFYDSGYLNLAIQGSQVIAERSIQGKRSALLFTCKIITSFDQMKALNYINNCCSRFFDQLLGVSIDILKSISQRKDRKLVFSAICSSILNNYFTNSKLLGDLVNALISNTVDRFSFKKITEYVKQAEQKQKKEATYKKLQVFKQFQKPQAQLVLDEQQCLVQTFKKLANISPDVVSVLQNTNRERMWRLCDKYQK